MGRETDELKFERQLYDYLANLGGSKQWQQMDNLKTSDDLWDNFRQIVYRLNQDKLPQPLSNPEFNQVKKQLLEQTQTPYHAGVFLYGVNGKSQVEIDRDDGQHVFLTLFDQDQIGAGDTIYQVATQIELKNKLPGKKNRRFDTTLLINGLPIIQIEEKADGHSAKEALNQMHQYQAERQYTDIFSTVQILVALTPHDARYMANTTADTFNDAFAFQWKQNGKKQPPILDWREFADQFLSIPMAHKMATNYMILDNTPNRQMIKVMRYYQVYATQTIVEKLTHHDFAYSNGESQKVGYIWHTTGSGKTISSFKTAFLASRLPNVDKVVFLVDRVALTNQTVEEYQAYDPNADDDNQNGIVTNTANIFDLKRKLLSKQKTTIVVTSTQKMDKLVKSDRFKMNDQRVVFIVDEAHRSTGGEMIADIKKAFPKSAWIGYTGTPNFDPKLGPTTEYIFGPPLHRYVISDAIADHNVLGFQVDFKTTIPKDELETKYLPQYFKKQYPKWTEAEIRKRIKTLSPEDMDDNVSPSVYDMQDQHIHQVVADILHHWNERSVQGRYNALFTTHVGGKQASTPMAMKYFDEFQKQMKETGPMLKVAVTFSQDNSNSDSQLETNQNLAKAMKNYNQLFKTDFDDTNVDEYTADLVTRLNRTASDGNYLDIVIVIDQLLTGFDAPQLNTLYVDRTLRGANLIQAYSRTNRIQNMLYKPYGRIINYRWPANSEKLMKQALSIYSNPDSADVNGSLFPLPPELLAKPYDVVLQRLQKTVQNIAELTSHFQLVPASESAQEETYNQLVRYNHLIARIKQYDEFDAKHPERFLSTIGMNADQESRLTGPIADNLKEYMTKKYHNESFNLTLRMEQVKEVKVNYDYLHELIAQYANWLNDEQKNQKETEKLRDKIYQILNSLDDKDKKYADEVRSLMKSDLKKIVQHFPIKPEQVDRLVHQHSNNWSDEQLRAFVHEWGLSHYQNQQGIKDLIKQHQVGNHDDLKRSNFLDQLVRFGQQHYQRDASIDVQKLSKLKYHNQLNKAFQKIADHIKKRI